MYDWDSEDIDDPRNTTVRYREWVGILAAILGFEYVEMVEEEFGSDARELWENDVSPEDAAQTLTRMYGQ